MYPAPLVLTCGIELLQGIPESQGSVSYGKFRPFFQTPAAEPREKLIPACGRPSVAVFYRHELFSSFFFR